MVTMFLVFCDYGGLSPKKSLHGMAAHKNVGGVSQKSCTPSALTRCTQIPVSAERKLFKSL